MSPDLAPWLAFSGRMLAAKPGCMPDPAEQANRCDWANAIDRSEPRPRCGNSLLHLILDLGQACIDRLGVLYQVSGYLLTEPFNIVDGSDSGQQPSRRCCSERDRRAAWDQVTKHRVQLVGHPGALLSHVRAAFFKHRTDRGVILSYNN